MGICLADQGRHASTRAAHAGMIDPRMPIDSIIGANSEVTNAIEAHRQALRDGGFVQPPAPTETVETIECPVNLRKDSIRILGASDNKSNNGDKSIEETLDECKLSILCSLDTEVESLLEVVVIRKKAQIRRRMIRINERGIGVSALVDLAPTQTELTQLLPKPTPFMQKLWNNKYQNFLADGDIIELELVPINISNSTEQ